MKDVDCLAIGDSFFDVTTVLSHRRRPIISGGTVNIKSMLMSPGGVGNVAVTVSYLGGKSAFCGMVGGDILGNIYHQDLKENGVLPILFKHTTKPTGILISFISRSGQRSFLVSRGANDDLDQRHVDKMFRRINPKVIYISGHSLTDKKMRNTLFYAAQKARKRKIKVIFDCTPHNLIRSNRNIFRNFLKMASCCCLNLEEANALTNERRPDAIIRSLKESADVIALKLGENGCIIAANDQIIRIKAPQVQVVDTTGAGDCFAAAIAFGLARNLKIKDIAKLGVKISTLKVQTLGPRLALTIKN